MAIKYFQPCRKERYQSAFLEEYITGGHIWRQNRFQVHVRDANSVLNPSPLSKQGVEVERAVPR